MAQFNSQLKYGKCEFPSENGKWSSKARNDGYRTIIIGNCEWFAEDIEEVLLNPSTLNLSDSEYNNDTSESKLHEVKFYNSDNLSQVPNCTPYWKWIPTTQGGYNGGSAQSDPTIPPGVLPCYVKTDKGKYLYNFKGAKLLVNNLPKQLKEEGWKLPDESDILDLFNTINKSIDPSATTYTTITNFNSSVTPARKREIRDRLLSADINDFQDIVGVYPTKLEDGNYINSPSNNNYDSNLNVANNTSGFSAIYSGSIGTCGFATLYGSAIPNNYNSLNNAQKYHALQRHVLYVGYWGQTTSATPSPSNNSCTYSGGSAQAFGTINGCASSSNFSVGAQIGFSLRSASVTFDSTTLDNEGPGIIGIGDTTIGLGCSIRLCRKLPFKVSNNRNLGLETTNIGSSDSPSLDNNISYYLPHSSSCTREIDFNIKNNSGGTRVIKKLHFKTSYGNNPSSTYNNIQVYRVATNNIETLQNTTFSPILNYPSVTITFNTAVSLLSNESLRVVIEGNFQVINDGTINFFPVITLDDTDPDYYDGTYPAGGFTSGGTQWRDYKIAKNLPILLNKQYNETPLPPYSIITNSFDVYSLNSYYDGNTWPPSYYRSGESEFGNFPIITTKRILSNEFNNWVFAQQANIPELQSFILLTNPSDYNFTPNDPFIFDESPQPSGYIEFRIPNPTINTIEWNITDATGAGADLTYEWINAYTNAPISTSPTCTHDPDNIIKLKITWEPTSAYTLNDSSPNLLIVPTGCDSEYGWNIKLSGQSEPNGPSANIICNPVLNPNPVILNTGIAASFTITIQYTEGNGVAYSIPAVSSTGVTGLSSNPITGTLANGNGSIVFTITGTPASDGNANFSFDIFGSKTCDYSFQVTTPKPNDLSSDAGCIGAEIIFNNYTCNIASSINNILVGGVPASFYENVGPDNACQLIFTIPPGLNINNSTTVQFYNGVSLLEELDIFIKPCGTNYFGPDANIGAQGCQLINYTNPDCTLLENLDSIIVDGIETTWSINNDTPECQISIRLPENTNTGYVQIRFLDKDSREIKSENYLITASCSGDIADPEPDLSCDTLTLLGTDNLTFLDCNNTPIVFEEGAVFTKTGWTISFSTELGAWSSRHTYQPYMYIYNSKAMYTLSKYTVGGSTINSFWKHTEKAKRLQYYDNIDISNIFEIEIIFPGEDKRTNTGTSTTKNSNKIFSAFAISSDSFISEIDKIQNEFRIPFNKFYVYNSFQLSGEIEINYLSNLRRVDGSWVINEFRDASIYGNNGLSNYSPGQDKMFIDEGIINTSYIDYNKNWYEKKKFVDKWIGLRLIYNTPVNNSMNLVYLYNVVFNSRPSFR